MFGRLRTWLMVGRRERHLRRLGLVRGPDDWKPRTADVEQLLVRAALHASTMTDECAREMNAVFERHYDIRPLRGVDGSSRRHV